MKINKKFIAPLKYAIKMLIIVWERDIWSPLKYARFNIFGNAVIITISDTCADYM